MNFYDYCPLVWQYFSLFYFFRNWVYCDCYLHIIFEQRKCIFYMSGWTYSTFKYNIPLHNNVFIMNYRETNQGLIARKRKRSKKILCHLITIGHLHYMHGRGYVVIFIRIESKWNFIWIFLLNISDIFLLRTTFC